MSSITQHPVFKKLLASCALIYFVAQIFFLISIQFPSKQNFDEFHYVPSAKQFLEMKENQNWEHPPLAELLMAGGLAIGGDRPLGWRLMSTIFGALTLVGMFLWGFAVFRSFRAAWIVTGLTLVNHLLYVQSRIGMLDTFMFAFIVWALAAFCATWNPRLPLSLTKKLLCFSGVMFGLATACKWMGIIPWALCLGLVALIKLFQYWGVTFNSSADANSFRKGSGKPKKGSPQESLGTQSVQNDDWYQPDLWAGIRPLHWALFLIGVPVLAYFFTFIPYLFVKRAPGVEPYTVLDFFKMQKNMWEGQQRVVDSHPYMSNWKTWPFMTRPIWYAFDKEGGAGEWVRGVLLLGNPLIMWAGLVAWLVCIRNWIVLRSRKDFLITVIYAAFVFCWIAIPRKVAFYYYYYPVGMTLSLALTSALNSLSLKSDSSREPLGLESFKSLRTFPFDVVFLGLATVFFIYFFPVLAGLKIPSESFRDWMWLNSWI